MNGKPYSQACENNKQFILSVLKNEFSSCHSVLEVGSGTGQHAVFFAKALPHLTWQTSDLTSNHQGINQWIQDYPSTNLFTPIELDLTQSWPIDKTDAIYTANTLHIVSWELVVRFFEGVDTHLSPQGKLCIYGPFNYNGEFTSESNANFDVWLKQRDSRSGIRDIEKILLLAESAGLRLVCDYEMPANNRLLAFQSVK